MSLAAADALRDALDAGSLSVTSGVDLFCGPERATSRSSTVPVNATYIAVIAAPESNSRLFDGANRRRALQVLVRRHEWREGQTLVDELFALADGLNASVTGYYRVECESAGPTYLGRDNHGVHRWTFNVSMFERETT